MGRRCAEPETETEPSFFISILGQLGERRSQVVGEGIDEEGTYVSVSPPFPLLFYFIFVIPHLHANRSNPPSPTILLLT